jgi:hypothetical protein
MAVVLSSMVVSLLSNSELPLVEFGDRLPHTLLKVCSARKDKVEIKCMDSVGGKTPTEPKLYLLFSRLRHIES